MQLNGLLLESLLEAGKCKDPMALSHITETVLAHHVMEIQEDRADTPLYLNLLIQITEEQEQY